MKTLKKISLSSLAKSELEDRELNKILGGENCCICGCQEPGSALNEGNTCYDGDKSDTGGYASGSCTSRT